MNPMADLRRVREVFDRVRGRENRLRALADLDGVYVPALYPMEQLDDGRILPVLGAPPVRKRIARTLDGS